MFCPRTASRMLNHPSNAADTGLAMAALEQLVGMTSSVSVVICAYTEGRWEALREAVSAVLTQKPPPAEVVLVIDHNDALRSRALNELPGVAVVANAHARGLSGARNTGVERASGEIVAFLDDDARPRPGWLAELAQAFEDPEVIGVGGVARPRFQSEPPRWLPPEFLWVVGCSYRGIPRQASEIRNPIGANMAFRREVFAQVGGFTHGIGRVGRTPLGCEETELSIRASAATGGSIRQLPGAVVDHLVPDDRARWSYFWRRCWAEGISKAAVARSVGPSPALRSERDYVLRTLPSGVLRGLVQALRGESAGLGRAAAIIAGLALTSAGYARGALAARARGDTGAPTFGAGAR